MTALVRGSGTTLYDNSEAEHIEGTRLHGNSENTAERLQSTRNTVAAGSMCSTGLSEVPCARSVSIRWINLDDEEDRASHMRAMLNASQATDTGEVIRSAQRFRAVMATCEACNRDKDGSGCVQVVGACGRCNVSSCSSFSNNFTNAHESNWNRGDPHRHQFVGVWSSHTSALHNVCHTLLERTLRDKHNVHPPLAPLEFPLTRAHSLCITATASSSCSLRTIRSSVPPSSTICPR